MLLTCRDISILNRLLNNCGRRCLMHVVSLYLGIALSCVSVSHNITYSISWTIYFINSNSIISSIISFSHTPCHLLSHPTPIYVHPSHLIFVSIFLRMHSDPARAVHSGGTYLRGIYIYLRGYIFTTFRMSLLIILWIFGTFFGI